MTKTEITKQLRTNEATLKEIFARGTAAANPVVQAILAENRDLVRKAIELEKRPLTSSDTLRNLKALPGHCRRCGTFVGYSDAETKRDHRAGNCGDE